MKPREFTKAQRREVRRLAALAHERELSQAVGVLRLELDRWQRGEMSVFDLNERIHQFHNGASRDLYKRYAMGDEGWSVAAAVVRGVLQESEVEASILERLQGVIDVARQMSQEDDGA
jgi:hypothetical protein